MFLLDIYQKISTLSEKKQEAVVSTQKNKIQSVNHTDKPRKQYQPNNVKSSKVFDRNQKFSEKSDVKGDIKGDVKPRGKSFLHAGYCNYIKDYQTFVFNSREGKLDVTIKGLDDLEFEDAEQNKNWHYCLKNFLYETIGIKENKPRIFLEIDENRQATIYRDFQKTENLLTEILELRTNIVEQKVQRKKPAQNFNFN